jgi:hypothetical protein
MAASSRYRALGRTLERLRKHHLGFARRLAGGYTERQLSQAAAYTVFAHGEFEHFLEDWASEIVDAIAVKGFGPGFSPMLAHLMAYRPSLTVALQIPANNAWKTTAGSAINVHRTAIRNNHGISERYVCALLIPLGVDVISIDPILISDLNAFAKIRGDHAHQSLRVHLGQQFDPFDRLTKVNNIYSLLQPFDEDLQKHLNSPLTKSGFIDSV